MTAIDVKYIWSDGGDNDGECNYTAVYHVTTNNRLDGPITARTASGVPQWGDYYAIPGGTDFDVRSTCNQAKAKLLKYEDTMRYWEVTLQYSTKGSKKDPNQNQNNTDQVDWNWRASGSYVDKMKAPNKDKDGRALVNMAEEPFLPPPEIDDPQMGLVLEHNTRTLSLGTWLAARGKVNSVTMWALIPRAIKLRQWTWNVNFVGKSSAYIAHRFELELLVAGHYYEPLNAGYRERNGLNIAGQMTYNYAKSEQGFPLSRPRLLDANGKFNPAAANPTFFDQNAGNLQKFKLEDEYDFSTILPPVIPGPITT